MLVHQRVLKTIGSLGYIAIHSLFADERIWHKVVNSRTLGEHPQKKHRIIWDGSKQGQNLGSSVFCGDENVDATSREGVFDP